MREPHEVLDAGARHSTPPDARAWTALGQPKAIPAASQSSEQAHRAPPGSKGNQCWASPTELRHSPFLRTYFENEIP